MATQKFDIKMCRPPVSATEDIILGRFPEGSAMNIGSKTLVMGYLDEDIVEDPDLASVEKGTSEYYARRKKRRYKSKTTLALKDAAPCTTGSTINLNGSLLDTKTEGGTAAKYALLETVNRGGRMEVNMIPVDQWYSFKKPTRAAAITLDDLEIAFDQQERQKAVANKKYSRVKQAMELNSSDYNKKRSTGEDWSEGGEDIAFGAPLFGPEATKALSRSSARSVEYKKFKGYMDDAGGSIAKGEDNEMDLGGYDEDVDDTFRDRSEAIDYDNNFSDDDNDADALQKADEEREDTLGREIDAAGGEDSDENGYDDSGADSDTSGKEDVIGSSGLYEADALVRSAMEYSFLLKKQEQKKLEDEGDSSGQPAAKKQKLSSGSATTKGNGNAAKQRDSVDKSKTSAKSSNAGNSSGYEFSEAGIRQFISVREGGRTTVKKILEQFKKQMKAIGPTAAGKLKEILLKITTTVEDAVLGKIIMLK